jgi:[ribosomal protein S18]-alanine N-acetyltransferase
MRTRELTAEEAETPLGWLYAGRYATCDVRGPLGANRGFFWVEDDDGAVVGYGCVGAEARIPAVDPESGTVDIGYGMRPDLTGQGLGREFVGAVLAYARAGRPDVRVRMLILRWNERSRRVAQAHGFRVVGRAGEFDVLVREPPREPGGAEYRHP